MATTKFIFELEADNDKEAQEFVEALMKMVVENLPELIKHGVKPKFLVGFNGDSISFDELKRDVVHAAEKIGMKPIQEMEEAVREFEKNGGLGGIELGGFRKVTFEDQRKKTDKKSSDNSGDDPFIKRLKNMFDED